MNERYLVISRQKIPIKEVLERLKHRKDLELQLDSYESINARATWKCNKCGNIWHTSVNKITSGRGCPKCAGVQAISLEDFLERNKHRTDISLFNETYNGIRQRAKFKCNACGLIWHTSPYSVDRGSGCPKCIKRGGISKSEDTVTNFIKSKFPHLEVDNHNRSLIKSPYSNQYLEVDIYLPDLKLGIEFDGRFYHTDEVISRTRKGFTSAKEYHDYKDYACMQLGIGLYHIAEQDYMNDKDKVLRDLVDLILLVEEQVKDFRESCIINSYNV